MVKIGEENMIAVTPASGIMVKAIASMVCEAPCEPARIRCAPIRRVRKTTRPAVGRMNAPRKISETSVRVNSTSPIG